VAVERAILVTFGTEALGAFTEAMTGNDEDVLLAIEQTIIERIGGNDEGPDDDAMGVYVTDVVLIP
jgi:hypothetical protein